MSDRVSLQGVEGTSAVRASDYAISRFHFLRRLIFVHGKYFAENAI